MKPVPPCRRCEERTMGCHASCERYREYKEEVAAYNVKVNAARDRETQATRFMVEQDKRVRIATQVRYLNRKNNGLKEVKE